MSDLQKHLLRIKKFLDKGHRPFCQIKNFTDKHCTCGLEDAQAAYDEIVSILKKDADMI